MKNMFAKWVGVAGLTLVVLVVVAFGRTEASLMSEDMIAASGSAHMADVFGKDYTEFIENNLRMAEVARRVEAIVGSYGGEGYPAFYGGTYISEDSLGVVVQIVGQNVSSRDVEAYEIYRTIGEMDDVVMNLVRWSLNELNAVNDMVVEQFFVDGASGNLSMSGVNVMGNVVDVMLVDDSEVMRKELVDGVVDSMRRTRDDLMNELAESVVWSGMLEFRRGEFNAAAARAGDWISGVGGRSCSAGFRTRLNGRTGYMTAGHCVGVAGTSIPTGLVRLRQFAHGQWHDFAFVETLFPPSNLLRQHPAGITTLAVANFSPHIGPGVAIGKSGMSTGFTSGSVINTNSTVSLSGTIVHGMVTANLMALSGDSGGPVFNLRNDASGGPVPLGVMAGSNGAGFAAFTPITGMPPALQLGRY